ncbi:hypothetical protein [Devosia sp. FJ2-5-3]|uniref:hypothetical protein n=1 Tax=Devosia sp. FJ2-5-3 TaxID=2976680 RepID=UPI0023D7C2A0|nr:hypothetical protein [Devosia sp. FJ2-5-3]WEJ57475.1 hypothetical protein N0P34_14900 [Devosia sp. FJ2-5-3]
MIVLHEGVEFGLALASEAVGGTKKLTVRPQHHPCSGLFTLSEGEAMGGEPPVEFSARGAIGPGHTHIVTDNGEVDPGPLCRLMLDAGKGSSRALASTQMSGKLVSYIGLTFRSQGSKDR